MTDQPEPPSSRVTGPSQRVEDPVAILPSLGRGGEVAVVQHFLRLGADALDDPSRGSSASFMRWMIATTRPALTVTVGHGDPTVRLSMRDAVERTGAGARFVAVRTGNDDSDSESTARSALGGDARIGLLHVDLSGKSPASDLGPWFELLEPGATVVFTGSAEGQPAALDRIAADTVPRHFRAVRVSLGIDGEALVAQEPIDGSSRSVDLLENVPGAVGSMLTLFGDQAEARGSIGDAVELSAAAETLLDRLIDRHEMERTAFLEALRTYQDLTIRLSDELSAVRQGLALQIESARLEREALVKEFLDRVDLLAVKVSTGASKHAAEITLKERQLEDAENRVLAYAGLAASAEAVVDDIHRSSSWKVTAPLRFFSGLMRRRAGRQVGRR